MTLKNVGAESLKFCFAKFYDAQDCITTRPCAKRANPQRRRAQAPRDEPHVRRSAPVVVKNNILRQMTLHTAH